MSHAPLDNQPAFGGGKEVDVLISGRGQKEDGEYGARACLSHAACAAVAAAWNRLSSFTCAPPMVASSSLVGATTATYKPQRRHAEKMAMG